VSLLLVFCRSGGNWSTTYAPSPFYMTSKMRSLYLEGYDYSIFDLTRPDRVQIQVGRRFNMTTNLQCAVEEVHPALPLLIFFSSSSSDLWQFSPGTDTRRRLTDGAAHQLHGVHRTAAGSSQVDHVRCRRRHAGWHRHCPQSLGPAQGLRRPSLCILATGLM